MIPVLWGLIVAVVDLLWLLAELGLGMHDAGYSHATFVLWVIIPAAGSIGSMIHMRKLAEDPYGYWRAVRTGMLTTLIGAVAALGVWILFVKSIEPDFFRIMIDYAMMVAKAAPNVTKFYLAAQLTNALLIFSSPNFYIIGVAVPLVVGTLVSLMVGVFVRRRVAG